MNCRRSASLAGMVASTALLAACASASSDAMERSLVALAPPSTTAASTPPTTSPPKRPRPPCDEEAKFDARSARPDMTGAEADTFLAEFRERGSLVVGVDENTLGLGYRNPVTGALEGFEVDLLRKVAEEIFGDPDAIVFKTVTTNEKVRLARDGEVDLTASAVSMTCERWQEVAFTSAYYEAVQKVMVRSDSSIDSIEALDGKLVCVTKGSTSLGVIRDVAPGASTYEVDTRTECPLALQEGAADAVFTHDTFLQGFQAQDPNTRILDDPRFDVVQPYGMATSWETWEDLELVRYVNGLLERWRADGTLAQLARDSFVAAGLGSPRPIPDAEYWN